MVQLRTQERITIEVSPKKGGKQCGEKSKRRVEVKERSRIKGKDREKGQQRRKKKPLPW